MIIPMLMMNIVKHSLLKLVRNVQIGNRNGLYFTRITTAFWTRIWLVFSWILFVLKHTHTFCLFLNWLDNELYMDVLSYQNLWKCWLEIKISEHWCLVCCLFVVVVLFVCFYPFISGRTAHVQWVVHFLIKDLLTVIQFIYNGIKENVLKHIWTNVPIGAML